MKATKEQLQNLFEHSACTMLGYVPEELDLYTNQLKENGYLKDNFTVYETKGLDINIQFELTDPLPNDLNVFIIDLDDMENVGEFAIGLRFDMGYRWLDDVVENRR